MENKGPHKIGFVSYVVIAIILALATYGVGAINGIYGVAGQKTPTTFNNIKDASVGDAQTSGILATAIYLWDTPSQTFNRWNGAVSVSVAPTPPSASFTYGWTSVTSAATLITASDPSRKSVIVKNSGSSTCYIGSDSSVTSATGMPLESLSSITLDKNYGNVYCICNSGESTGVNYIKE